MSTTHAISRLILIVLLYCFLVFIYFSVKKIPLFVEWDKFDNLPFTVERYINLAVRQDTVKTQSLDLVCSSARDIYIVLRFRLEEGRSTSGQGERAHFSFGELDMKDYTREKSEARSIEFERMKIVSLGLVDTLITESLSADQLERVATLFGPSPPTRVFYVVFEHVASLTSITGGEPLRTFAAQCLSYGAG